MAVKKKKKPSKKVKRIVAANKNAMTLKKAIRRLEQIEAKGAKLATYKESANCELMEIPASLTDTDILFVQYRPGLTKVEINLTLIIPIR